MTLQRAIGNRAFVSLVAANPVAITPGPIRIRRMFDENDLKGSSTGHIIWKKYTPNKDAGAAFLNHLAQKCLPNGTTIDTGRLAAVNGNHAVVYSKIATFLNDVMGNFAAHSFTGSTGVHKNEQNRYPADPQRPERYFEFGITGTGQTRVVFDRAVSACYISAHYEAPKIVLVNGVAPQAAMGYMQHYIETTLEFPPLGP